MPGSKRTIGRNVFVDIVDYANSVPAKVDTGADSSSIWASDVTILSDGTLQFVLFGEGSPFYSGELIQTKEYTVATVRSAMGHEQIRYRVALSVRVKGIRIRAVFNLSDRSKNRFPILIGRRTLSNKFLVDVSLADQVLRPVFEVINGELNKELQQNPHEFYKKYHGRDL